MAVTPVALVDYMLWRSLLSWALGFGVTLAQMLFVGPALEQPGMDTAALPGMIPLIGLCALAGLGAPLFMLFLAATASDKVQGFAMAKFIGIGGLLILVGWFLPSPLDWLPALFPLSGGQGLLAVAQYRDGQRDRRRAGGRACRSG